MLVVSKIFANFVVQISIKWCFPNHEGNYYTIFRPLSADACRNLASHSGLDLFAGCRRIPRCGQRPERRVHRQRERCRSGHNGQQLRHSRHSDHHGQTACPSQFAEWRRPSHHCRNHRTISHPGQPHCRRKGGHHRPDGSLGGLRTSAGTESDGRHQPSPRHHGRHTSRHSIRTLRNQPQNRRFTLCMVGRCGARSDVVHLCSWRQNSSRKAFCKVSRTLHQRRGLGDAALGKTNHRRHI